VALLCLAASGGAQAQLCRSESFEGASYIVCSFDLTKDDLRIYWRGDNGQPYRTFAALAADLEGKGKSLRFGMNGGMYQGDLRPVGLYIENGSELQSGPLTMTYTIKSAFQAFALGWLPVRGGLQHACYF
jgi:uncharacterized protein YigE (DUF2233 family)